MLAGRRSHTGWKLWAAFATLCALVASSSWLPAGSDEPQSLEGQSFCYGAVGLVALLFAYRGLWIRLQRREFVWLRLAGASVLLLGMPTAVNEWARLGISDVGQATLFGLVPFVVVVVAMGRESIADEETGVRRFFVPALAAFGGALLLLSFGFPASTRGRTMFGVLLGVIVLVGFASVWIYRLLRDFGRMEGFAVVCLSNAVFLAACSRFYGESWSGSLTLISISLLCYIAELILLVWLLREMTPVRLAARYLVVPLLIVLEGLAILRPAFTVRMGAGLILMAGGAGYILFSRGSDPDAVLSIR